MLTQGKEAMERDIIGKFVVFFPGSLGTNTHHYFEDMKAAEDYCKQSSHRTAITYVLQDRTLHPTTKEAKTQLADVINQKEPS